MQYKPDGISLQTALVSLFAVVTILAVGLVGLFSYYSGKRAVNDVALQLRAEVVERINEHVQDYLLLPHQINHVNARAISLESGLAHDQERLVAHFARQVDLFPTVTSIYFGNVRGGLANSGREISDDSRYVIVTDGFQTGTFRKIALDSDARQDRELAVMPDFDARTRPWYVQARDEGGPVYSDIYIVFTGQDMSLAASRPVYDRQGTFLGVVSVDLFLSHISRFLQEQRIGKNGQAFILERSGELVACSKSRVLLVDDDPALSRRVRGAESENHVVQEAVRMLMARFDDLDALEGEHFLDFETHGHKHLLQVAPLQVEPGVDWLVAVSVPEADFMAGIASQNRMTILLTLGVLVLALLSGVLVSRGVVRPISLLDGASRKLASGSHPDEIAEKTWFLEARNLTRSFNLMSRKLSGSIQALNDELDQRRRVEEALLESEEMQRKILQTVPDLIIRTDLEGTITFVNEMAFPGLENVPETSIYGRNVFSFIVPDDLPRAMENARQRLERNIGPQEYQLRFDDAVIDAEVNGAVIRDRETKAMGMVYVIRDISERRRAEMERSMTLSLLDSTLNSMEEGILVIDMDGNVTRLNRAFLDLWQMPPGLESAGDEELLQHAVTQLADPEGFLSKVRQLYDAPELSSFDEIAFSDGRVFELYSQPQWLDGDVVGRVWCFRDITTRKQAEMELQEKNILLEGILDNIPDLVSVKRPDLSIIRYNRSGYDFLGTSLEQARGRKCYDLMGRTSPCQPCASLDAMRRKQLTRHENYYPKLGVHLHCQANPVIGADGRIEYVVELLRDITASKQAEQERDKLHAHLMQAQKMESVGILAGGVAHDFNNLLHAMRGNIEMLLQGKSADCPDARRLESVTTSMDRAAQLVKQLLLFSRKAEFSKILVDLNDEVLEVARMLERTIPKMIALELHLDPSIWQLVADPVQIEQVLLNLASNAVDAMPDGGKLTIETGNVDLDEDFVRGHPGSTAGLHVLLTVTDTGCGMDKEIMEHLFDPFFTTKEVGKGTGLGLASVYGIVKTHGGYIQCYSEPGLGTTFRVYLPAVEKGDVEQVEQMSEPSLRGGSETILVVDDEPEIRELTREALEMLGYSVKMAVNGEQALDIYREHGKSIDLVLLDLNMPGMGGHKCLKKLLRLDPDVKVVIASGYSANNHGKGVVSSGARDFIGKPYRLQELAVMVRKTLDG